VAKKLTTKQRKQQQQQQLLLLLLLLLQHQTCRKDGITIEITVTEYDGLSAPKYFSIGTVQLLSQKEYPICSGRCRSTSDSVYFARRLAQVVQCLVCNTLESSRVKHWRNKRRGHSCVSNNFIGTKDYKNTVVHTVFPSTIRRYTTIYTHLRTNRKRADCPKLSQLICAKLQFKSTNIYLLREKILHRINP